MSTINRWEDTNNLLPAEGALVLGYFSDGTMQVTRRVKNREWVTGAPLYWRWLPKAPRLRPGVDEQNLAAARRAVEKMAEEDKYSTRVIP